MIRKGISPLISPGVLSEIASGFCFPVFLQRFPQGFRILSLILPVFLWGFSRDSFWILLRISSEFLLGFLLGFLTEFLQAFFKCSSKDSSGYSSQDSFINSYQDSFRDIFRNYIRDFPRTSLLFPSGYFEVLFQIL